MKNNLLFKSLFFFVIIFLYYLTGVTDNLGLYGDDAGYIIWAKSILNGGWLDYINEPEPRPAGYNIFVLPLFLSLIMRFSNDVFYLKLVPLFFSAASIIIIFFSLKKLKFKNNIPLIVSFMMLFNGLFFEYSHQIMAENIMLFFVFLAFISLEKFNESPQIINLYAVFSVFACYAAFFSRTAGIAIIFTAILYFFIKKNLKKTFSVIFLLFFFFGIYLWALKITGKSTGSGGSMYLNILKMKSQYLPEAGDRGSLEIIKDSFRKLAVYSLRLTADAAYYPAFKKIKPEIKSPYFLSQIMLGAIISFLVVCGLFSRIVHKNKDAKIFLKVESSAEIYFIITIAILMLWQIYSSRYLLAVLPLIFAYALTGAFKILDKKIFFWKFFAYSIIICGFLNQLIIVYYEKNNIIPQEWKNYYVALEKIQELEFGKSESIVIACRKPTSYYVKSGYEFKTIGYPMLNNPDDTHKFMRKYKVKYIVKDNFFISGSDTSKQYLTPYIAKYASLLSEIYRSPDGETILYVFKN